MPFEVRFSFAHGTSLWHGYPRYDLVLAAGGFTVVAPRQVVPVSIRLDGAVLAELRTEAHRLGIPYQTFVGSILHRYVHRQLVDPKAADLKALLKRAS
jgi:hypothetical protein